MDSRRAFAGLFAGFVSLLGASAAGWAAGEPYPQMAPLSAYLEANDGAEIALARSAAPPSISDAAEILVLGSQGYHPAVQGKNGFVCLVERSWFMGFADPEFWNPKFRAPDCHNRAAARSILKPYLERTRWVLAGVSIPEMVARTKAELSAGTFTLPDPQGMSYMLSSRSHLHDEDGHWHPHLMFYLLNVDAASWGANMKGSPLYANNATIFADETVHEPYTTLFLPVPKWSDGSAEQAH
jgi:hypothetical protein